MYILFGYFLLGFIASIFLMVILIEYLVKKGTPHFKIFLLKKWYPYRRKKCLDFVDKMKNSIPDKRIKNNIKIEKTLKKINYLNTKIIEDEPPQEIPTIDEKQIDLTDRIKSHISEMIDFEVINYIRQPMSLNQKINILQLDTAIKQISEKVKNGLSPSVFNTSLVCTKEYVMEFIVNQTYTVLLKTITEYNRRLSS